MLVVTHNKEVSVSERIEENLVELRAAPNRKSLQ